MLERERAGPEGVGVEGGGGVDHEQLECRIETTFKDGGNGERRTVSGKARNKQLQIV